MRWFRGGAEKQFKGKYRVRKSPKPKQAPAPKYKSPKVVKRLPKVRKPVVDIPFVDAAFNALAYSGPLDVSAMALHSLEGAWSTKVRWVSTSRSDGCARNECSRLAAGGGWNSVESFLEGRPMKAAPAGRPSAGSELGIYGYSHPGCDCHLIVTMSDGSSYEIGPEDGEPRQVAPSGPVVEAPPPVEDEFTSSPEMAPEAPEEAPEEPEAPAEAGIRGGLVAHGIWMERVEDELGSEEGAFW